MDINSLLSPDPESANSTPPASRDISPRSPSRSTPPSNGQANRPAINPRKSSGLSQELDLRSTPPPRAFVQEPRVSLPSIAVYNAAAASQAARQSSVNQRGKANERSGKSGSPVDPRRPPPTAGMDTLAEVASLQRPQHLTRAHELSSTSTISRTGSTRSSVDLIMPDAPPQPRVYAASSLSDAECRALSEQAARLGENSFDFPAHIEFIKLLHKGFAGHVEAGREPTTYELLAELRQARQAMDKIFSVGEDLWMAWLNDEILLSHSIDERLSLMELFHRSVIEEPHSANLWRLYGDYMHHLWSSSYDITNDDIPGWSADDKEIGKEIFKWEPMMDVWEQGVAKTQSHLNDSHVVWDRYIEILVQDQSRWPSPRKVENIKEKFAERLVKKAHATWDQTFQNFSNFISTHDNASYEESMVNMSKRGQQVKKLYAGREPFEFKIQQAVENNDKDAEWAAYSEYLSWELRMKGVFSAHRINGLFERATVRFATDPRLWVDYIEFLIQNPDKEVHLGEILERATRHCPWSGELWSHRILALEAEGKQFAEIEETKHKATVTGLLDMDGLEGLMKVYIAWCGCLRRRAFMPGASEDDLDIAEVGIRSALEHVRKSAERKYGNDFKGDPQYRLERIHIKFLTQRGDVALARDCWKALVKQQGDHYEFWSRFYLWEMIVWARFGMRVLNDPENYLDAPPESTHVLRQALHRVETMDWPEQLIPMYQNHCELHESVQVYRTAIIEVRNATRKVAERREKEAAAWKQQQVDERLATEDAQSTGKRKRNAESEPEEQVAKKTKADEEQPKDGELTAQPKRDREHTTIVVKNMPLDATELKVRQFFRDCGTINSIKTVTETDSKTATVEFDTKEDALFAQTKVTRPFDGNIIDIEFSVGTTLWVTNYPPTADEQYIRDLFKECGEIVEVRFPSLQGNTNRRFCYVQFLTPGQALEATKLDGKILDGKHHLQAKVSDPAKKQDRQGALYEGREVYISNVHWGALEEDVKAVFSSCGPVEKVRIPRNMNGKSKGIAFVSFTNKESAEKAVATLNNTPLKFRPINVELSMPMAKRTQTTIIRHDTASTSPDPGLSESGAARSNGVADGNSEAHSADIHGIRARTLAILDLPDTVTSARIEKLLEPFGALKKITLRPDHGGAIAEFVEEKSVGVASLALERIEMDGKLISTGTVDQLLKGKREVKSTKLGQGKKKSSTASVMSSGLVSRPAQGSARRGRGGLGMRTAGFGGGRPVADGGAEPAPTGGKSNAEFRALLLKGKDVKDGDATEK